MKVLKITSYTLAGLIALYFILLVCISTYISSHKEKIIGDIKKAIYENARGEVSLQNIDISLWSSFPNIEISLSNFSLKDSLYHISVISMKEIGAKFSLTGLLGKEITIKSIFLKDGYIHFLTDSSGYDNSYLFSAKKKKDSSAKPGKSLLIKNISLQNVQLLSENLKAYKKFDLRVYALDADIDKQNDSVNNINLYEKCLIKGLGFDLSKGSYLNNQLIEAKWKMQLDTKNLAFAFNQTEAQINDHLFLIDGAFFLKDSSHFALHVLTDQLNFKQAQQLVPNNILKILRHFAFSKPLDVKASISGPMAAGTTPLVNIIWSIKDNNVSTSAVSFDSCSFNGLFTNQVRKELPKNDYNSEVLVSNFSGYWGQVKLLSKNIIVSNLDSPMLNFQMQSNSNFQQLDASLNLNSLRFISGDANLHVLYNGALITDFSLLDKLTLDFECKNGQILYVPRNISFTNFNGNVLLSNDNLKGGNFQCDVKKNHFQVNITGTQLSKLSDSVEGKANIFCTLTSDDCNLADFNLFSPKAKTKERKKAQGNLGQAASQIDNLLVNGNLFATISAKKVYYKKFIATDVNAKMLFAQNDWEVQNASLTQSNGKFAVSAKVKEAENYRELSANFSVQNADVKKLFYSFGNFGLSLGYQNLTGTVNTSGNFIAGFDQNGNLQKKQTKGNLYFSVKNGSIQNFAPLEQIKISVLKDRDLSNIQFAELKDSIDIYQTDLYLHRMEVRSTALTCYVEGIYSLADKTNISIQVPLNNLKKHKDDFSIENQGVDAKTGPSIYLRVKNTDDGKLKVGLDVFRKLRGDDFKDFKNN